MFVDLKPSESNLKGGTGWSMYISVSLEEMRHGMTGPFKAEYRKRAGVRLGFWGICT